MNGMDLNLALVRLRLEPMPAELAAKFSAYQTLLDHWNTRMNLTSIRDREQQVSRHFVESIFCARHLPQGIETVLDFGSGAGFPGVPIALCRPELRVTLGESQGKKASFLREAVRTLGIGNAEVFDGRIEIMEEGREFGAVTMRAVDKMPTALAIAVKRVRIGGVLVVFTTESTEDLEPEGFEWREDWKLPGSERSLLRIGRRS
jgi:16S rRNA (guanine527-N7)-methyltransferase